MIVRFLMQQYRNRWESEAPAELCGSAGASPSRDGCTSLFAAIVFCTAWFAIAVGWAEEKPQATPEQERFFEEKIRPLLAAHCWECHGAKKQEFGLRLDGRDLILRGGESGERAAVPGEPEKSLLIRAVTYKGDVQMPPKGKLPDDQIAHLIEWVKQGLPWPAAGAAAPVPLTAAERAIPHRQSHWAFQPIQHPQPPLSSAAASVHNPIDAFVLEQLREKQLTPSPEADRRTLLRRLSFDLHGLPPTAEESDAFAADPAPDAYERAADRLLASPRLGARWGRHWLDVARYADTRGYAFAKDRRYPYSYTYRDYVIGAMNSDLPFNRFIVEQLAADKLDLGENKAPLAAMGFLTTGRRFNNIHDDIDDQIDAVTRGLMGLTVSCARCHDHKYDAVPSEDYYSLYGVFSSSREPEELPIIGASTQAASYAQFEEELKKRKTALEDFQQKVLDEAIVNARKQTPDYLAKVAAQGRETLLDKLPFLSLDPKDLRPQLVERWRKFLAAKAKPESATWGLWADLLALAPEKFSAEAPSVLTRWHERPQGLASGQFNPLVKAVFAEEPPLKRMDVPKLYGKLLASAAQAWNDAGASDEAVNKLPAETRPLAEAIAGKEAPPQIPAADLANYLSRADRNQQNELTKKIQELEAGSPAAPPRAMVMVDKPQPVDPRVFIRGNHNRPGQQVPRQFLLVAAEKREPFRQGSGRLELAEAIVDDANPLTRRVIANRVWMQHLGEPLVATPSDFGIRSDPPTHPELLDWMAAGLANHGWSLKWLHRQIICSATYRQQSLDRADCRQADPENRLLWRMNRRRLEWEALRDSVLLVSGGLDEAQGGRPVDLLATPYSPRRTVYGYLDRQDLPNLFRVFDIASPDSSNPRRPRTTVPQQALYLMNNPFVIARSQAISQLPGVIQAASAAEQVAALYRAVLSREPSAGELEVGREFLQGGDPTGGQLTSQTQLAQLLLLTNAFMFVD